MPWITLVTKQFILDPQTSIVVSNSVQ